MLYNFEKHHANKFVFQVGGFVTPFLVLGSTLFLSAVMTAFVLPDHPNRRNDVTSDGNFEFE